MDTGYALELGPIPLISGEGSLPPPPPVHANNSKMNPEDDDKYLTRIPPWTVRELIVAGLATVATILSIVIILIPFLNPFVFVTGLLGIFIAPYSALQEQKITDTKAMQQTNAAMERELANLKEQNERIAHENERLEESVSGLQKTKDVLAEIQQSNVHSITELEGQLKESQAILDNMEENYRAEVVDNIFEVMLALDKDGDYIMDDDEIETVIKKIEKIERIEINDELFRQKIIETGRDLDAVLKLINHIIDDDPNTEPGMDDIIKFIPPQTNSN